MWNPGLYPEEQAELAVSPPSCTLTVKDLLLSGSGGDLVSSLYPNSQASELGGPLGCTEPHIPISETEKLSHRQRLDLSRVTSKASLWVPVLSSLSPELGHCLL